MKLYEPKYLQDNNQYTNFKEGIKADVNHFVIDGILAPIAMILLFFVLVLLFCMAFGKDQYFGHLGKVIVGVGELTIVVGSIVSTKFGNFIIWLWVYILLAIVVFCLLYIAYCFLTPAFEYFSVESFLK